MFDVFSAKGFWNDTPDLAAAGEGAFGDFVHKTDAAAPRDQADPSSSQEASQLPGGFGIGRTSAPA